MGTRNDLPDRPWTKTEVAEYLQVSERTVDYRIRDAGLPFVRMGGVMRFIREDVDAWLRGQPSVVPGAADAEVA